MKQERLIPQIRYSPSLLTGHHAEFPQLEFKRVVLSYFISLKGSYLAVYGENILFFSEIVQPYWQICTD